MTSATHLLSLWSQVRPASPTPRVLDITRIATPTPPISILTATTSPARCISRASNSLPLPLKTLATPVWAFPSLLRRLYLAPSLSMAWSSLLRRATLPDTLPTGTDSRTILRHRSSTTRTHTRLTRLRPCLRRRSSWYLPRTFPAVKDGARESAFLPCTLSATTL